MDNNIESNLSCEELVTLYDLLDRYACEFGDDEALMQQIIVVQSLVDADLAECLTPNE